MLAYQASRPFCDRAQPLDRLALAMLHITNGDAAANVLRKAGITDPILPWRDVLHEGPVPADLSLRELSQVRTEFIAECGWGRPEEIVRQFDAAMQRWKAVGSDADGPAVVRVRPLRSAAAVSGTGVVSRPTHVPRVVADQLERLRRMQASADSATLSPEAIAELAQRAQPVKREQLELAARAWEAFRSPEPVALDKVRARRHAGAARSRGGAEAPAAGAAGHEPMVLSRTEHAALSAVAEGARAPAEIFVAVHTREERPFMGDWPFWRLLARLSGSGTTLLELASGARPRFPPQVPAAAAFGAQRFRLTPAGREVLEGKRDAVHTIGIDRWWGGTHLSSDGTVWRWDEASETLSRD